MSYCAIDACTGDLYGDAVSHSDFQLNIKPPGFRFCVDVSLVVGNFIVTVAVEQLEDVEASLDALLKVFSSHAIDVCVACWM